MIAQREQVLYNKVRLLDGSYPDPENIWRIDAGAMPMIARMQRVGIEVDLTHFARMDTELTRDMERVTAEVEEMTGFYTHLGSGDQVSNLLFKKLGLHQAKRRMTPSEARESVADEILTAIQHQHPVVGLVLEYKEYEKLRGTYVRPMPKLARRSKHGVWRMHPKFRNTRVPSGRLSCADPNLLAMPNRTARAREVLNGFIAGQGRVLLSIDESQIEVRITAHRSRDPRLCAVYHNGEDVYSDFAIASFRLADRRYQDADGWHYPGVDRKEHRQPAKTCVLASIYRVTAGGLQEQMPIICSTCSKPSLQHNCIRFRALWTEDRCQDMLNAFFGHYNHLVPMMLADDRFMRTQAIICDMWGRQLHVQAVRSRLPWVVSKALREGGNFPCQSGAQGTIKLTMAAVDDDLRELYAADIVRPLLQVHDELLLEVEEGYAEEVGEAVKHRFETCVQLDVPIQAEYKTAPTWGDLKAA